MKSYNLKGVLRHKFLADVDEQLDLIWVWSPLMTFTFELYIFAVILFDLGLIVKPSKIQLSQKLFVYALKEITCLSW